MKALLILVVVLPLLALCLPAGASAQGVYIGAGLNFPTSDYSDEHDTGFLSVGGVSFDLPVEGMSAYVEGFWSRSSFSHDEYGEDAVANPYGVMGGLLYDFADEDSPGLYVFGQAGRMVHKFDPSGDDSTSGFGYGGGVGFGFPMDGVGFWIEGRYMGASIDYEKVGGFQAATPAFMAIMAGISMSLGGD
jgi:hypothetical protein